MEIISHPGAVPGVEPEHPMPGASIPPAQTRTRRIGGFLQELRLAECRLAGIREVFQAPQNDGSPEPRFDFGPARL